MQQNTLISFKRILGAVVGRLVRRVDSNTVWAEQIVTDLLISFPLAAHNSRDKSGKMLRCRSIKTPENVQLLSSYLTITKTFIRSNVCQRQPMTTTYVSKCTSLIEEISDKTPNDIKYFIQQQKLKLISIQTFKTINTLFNMVSEYSLDRRKTLTFRLLWTILLSILRHLL